MTALRILYFIWVSFLERLPFPFSPIAVCSLEVLTGFSGCVCCAVLFSLGFGSCLMSFSLVLSGLVRNMISQSRSVLYLLSLLRTPVVILYNKFYW